MSKFSISISMLAVAMAGANAAPAFAQDDAQQGERSVSSDGDMIVVTARKREENVQDVPVAITAFSGETLERAGVRTFDGLALNNPNVKIQPINSTAVGRSVAIRGNVQSSSTVSVDPSVGVYIDGHLIAHSFGNAGLLVDVASVQTLKGPQGTLFGRNTTGGALLVQTNEPETGDVSGYVQLDLGGVKTRRYGGAINVPVGDIAALRLVYQKNSQGNFQTFTNGIELGENEQEVLRAKLLVEPTDTLSVIFTAEKTNESVNSAIATPTFPNDPVYKNAVIIPVAGGAGRAPTDPRALREQGNLSSEFYGLRVTQDLESGNIKLIVGRRHWNLDAASTVGPGLGYTFQNKPGNDETSAELQYNGSLLDDRIDLAAGLFYFKEDVHERQNTFLYSGVQRTTRQLDATTESYSAYLQATFHATEQLNFTGGLRYTHDEKTGILRGSTRGAPGQADGTPATAALLAPATAELKQNRLNYLVSVDFRPIEGVMLYANHATGYRSGGSAVDRRAEAVASPLFTTLGTFQPESVKNYEVGFKTELFDRMITLNGAGFYQSYKNYQYTAINPVTVQRETLNVDAIIKGFELEGKLRLGSGTSISGSFGLTDAKIDSGPAEGRPLSYIPRTTYSVALNQNVKAGGGDIDFVAGYSWRNSFFSAITDPSTAADEEALTRVASVGLLNLSATYTNGPYTVAVFAENVTNEHYFTAITASPPVVSLGSLGTPRVIGFRAKYAF